MDGDLGDFLLKVEWLASIRDRHITCIHVCTALRVCKIVEVKLIIRSHLWLLPKLSVLHLLGVVSTTLGPLQLDCIRGHLTATH